MLTNSQALALKAYMLSETDQTFVDYLNTGNNGGMALFLNETASPDFIVWRTSVPWDEVMLNGMDWARVDNLSAGKARIWDWLFRNANNSMNPSKTNIRAGIDAAWVGTAPDLAVRASVYTHCKRAATRGEKATATGTGSNASPAILEFEGELSSEDIRLALLMV